MDEVFGLFPVPFMRVPAMLDKSLVTALIAHFSQQAICNNNSSPNLSHTEMLRPDDSALFTDAAARLTPKLTEFGALMFGEKLPWAIKEMWVNVLDEGGRQAMHNHANSFISGVVYLTPTHPQSQTVFMKSPGGSDFAFKNEHAGTTPGQYGADKWVSPAPTPGDMVLFPSYLMNAIPSRLESWGYGIRFSG
jgi:uncharacterized protein (TIGR02466 family)